ncbi:MAG: tautomerase PptA [Klebsiella michiganensis]|nr:tautomerase PptA [Klebsiella michiganensis]
MPHVDIKCFPRDLNDEQKAALAGVALKQVEPSDWQQVWDSEIAPQMEQLIKKPGYNM